MKFTEVLKQLNIEYRTEGKHCRDGWLQIDCPWCGKDSHKFHLGYSLSGHFMNCWRCGPHRPIETLMEITSKPFYECKKLLGDIRPITIPKKRTRGKLVLPKGLTELKKNHKAYLANRGFKSSELQKLWRIQATPAFGKLAWRIFIPIIYHGKTVSWTTRAIGDLNSLRYISASPKEESMPLKSLLYGEDYVVNTIIVTEGPFDVWRIGPGAVATLGIGYTTEQVKRMMQYPKRIICFDNETTAQQRARKLCDDLSVFPGETYIAKLDSNDAASASKSEIDMLQASLTK